MLLGRLAEKGAARQSEEELCALTRAGPRDLRDKSRGVGGGGSGVAA